MKLKLIFRIDGKGYGLEIDAVQEIMEAPKIHPVPNQRGGLIGAVNVHGEVLPVIDLPVLMGSPVAARDACLIVLTPAFRSLVLAVDRLEQILPLDLEQLAVSAETEADSFSRGGLACEAGDPVHLLSTSVVFERLERIFKANGGSYGFECDDRR